MALPRWDTIDALGELQRVAQTTRDLDIEQEAFDTDPAQPGPEGVDAAARVNIDACQRLMDRVNKQASVANMAIANTLKKHRERGVKPIRPREV